MASESGVYQFSTKSEDGSLLYIGEKLVVDNGGNHSRILKDSMVALKKEWHPLLLKYHEATGRNELTVRVTTRDGTKKKIDKNDIEY